jgi:hypothetical protein
MRVTPVTGKAGLVLTKQVQLATWCPSKSAKRIARLPHWVLAFSKYIQSFVRSWYFANLYRTLGRARVALTLQQQKTSWFHRAYHQQPFVEHMP